MFKKLLQWLGLVPQSQATEQTTDKIWPSYTYTSTGYTEEDLVNKTMAQLKTLGETKFNVTFKSNDRKHEMIARILDAQG